MDLQKESDEKEINWDDKSFKSIWLKNDVFLFSNLLSKLKFSFLNLCDENERDSKIHQSAYSLKFVERLCIL